MLEKTLEIPLDCKEIQPVHPKGAQSWVFIGRTDAEAEAPTLWPLDAKNRLTGKDPDAGKEWRQEEKGMTEDEMAGWHRWLDGRESEWTPGVGDGQGVLAYCSLWANKEFDMTEWLNWSELKWILKKHSQWVSESHSVMSDSLRPHGPHQIFQARILEWVAFPFPRGYSQPWDWTQVSCTADRFFTS